MPLLKRSARIRLQTAHDAVRVPQSGFPGSGPGGAALGALKGGGRNEVEAVSGRELEEEVIVLLHELRLRNGSGG